MPGPIRHQRRRRSHPSPAVCRTCKETFPSHNALFAHIIKELHFLRSCITYNLFVQSLQAKHHNKRLVQVLHSKTSTIAKSVTNCLPNLPTQNRGDVQTRAAELL